LIEELDCVGFLGLFACYINIVKVKKLQTSKTRLKGTLLIAADGWKENCPKVVKSKRLFCFQQSAH
jgi:hypothetical protein